MLRRDRVHTYKKQILLPAILILCVYMYGHLHVRDMFYKIKSI